MCNTLIGYFCSEHENWRELLSMGPYHLKIKEDGPYVIFNYNQIESDFSSQIVQEARGIIFRTGEWENPVCWAFNKFFNQGEPTAAEIHWPTSFVTEKIDGSLIKVWYDLPDRKWHISTNGIIDAFKAEIGDARMPNFGKYFNTALDRQNIPRIYRTIFDDFTETLNEQYTYMFELVGPYNRVVIPYEEPDLYFLGARNKFTGEELLPTSINMKNLGVPFFKSPAFYSLSTLEDCIKAAELKTWDDEGFVVCDANFNRVKIKSPSYVLAHYMRNNNVITKRQLLRVIIENEVEEFKCYASDYVEPLDDCIKLVSLYHKFGNLLIKMSQRARLMPRGAFAEMIRVFPKIFRDMMFMSYDRDITAEEYTSGWDVHKWERCLEEMEKLKDEYLF